MRNTKETTELLVISAVDYAVDNITLQQLQGLFEQRLAEYGQEMYVQGIVEAKRDVCGTVCERSGADKHSYPCYALDALLRSVIGEVK